MINIEVIAIGNEVLSGFTVNSNAAFISQQLIKQGWHVSRHTALPDTYDALLQGLNEALHRSSIVITTGGLGPTGDDITRQVAADLAGTSMRYDAAWAEELRRRYSNTLSTLDDQATIPASAVVLPNSYGTAPGLFMQVQGRSLFILPGVPAEMGPLFIHSVMPHLKDLLGTAPRTARRILHFFKLRESDVDVHLQTLQRQGIIGDYGIYPALGLLTVHLIANKTEEGQTKLDEAYAHLQKLFSENFFSSPKNTLEDAIQQILCQSNATLSIAESCTGGALAAKFTAIPGASKYFLGSVVAYSNEVKCQLLHIDKKTLEAQGAVSEAIAKEMAQNTLKIFHSDYALAVTGIAGPSGATPDKPIGTVWCAIACRDQPSQVWLETLRGDRSMVVERAIQAILGSFYQFLVRRNSLCLPSKLS